MLRAYPDTISIDIHCAQLGHWSSLPDKNFTKLCKIRINPDDVLDSGNEKLNAFTGEFTQQAEACGFLLVGREKCFPITLLSPSSDYLSSTISPGELGGLLESSEVVGNIRFSHPTLYVFPGGQGDSALFGINGFNMLGELLLSGLRWREDLTFRVFQSMVVSLARLAFGTLCDT